MNSFPSIPNQAPITNLNSTVASVSGSKNSIEDEYEIPKDAYKKILIQSVAVLLKDVGFRTAHSGILEVLTDLLTKYMDRLACSLKMVSEHAGRSLVNPNDLFSALSNVGTEIESFFDYVQRHKHSMNTVPPDPQPSSIPKSPARFNVAESQPHPSYFPSYLPPFPDAHTYLRTELVSDEVDASYIKVRDLQAKNRRDMEKSLVNFALLNYPTVSLFEEYERSSTSSDNKITIPKVLLPFEDPRPYITAMVSIEEDIEIDEDQNYLAHLLSKEMEELEENDDDENHSTVSDEQR